MEKHKCFFPKVGNTKYASSNRSRKTWPKRSPEAIKRSKENLRDRIFKSKIAHFRDYITNTNTLYYYLNGKLASAKKELVLDTIGFTIGGLFLGGVGAILFYAGADYVIKFNFVAGLLAIAVGVEFFWGFLSGCRDFYLYVKRFRQEQKRLGAS